MKYPPDSGKMENGIDRIDLACENSRLSFASRNEERNTKKDVCDFFFFRGDRVSLLPTKHDRPYERLRGEANRFQDDSERF